MSKSKSSIGIIGLGKFGMYLTEELSKIGKSLICIDRDETKVKKVLPLCDAGFVSEDLSTRTLEDTGFKECDTIIVCISEHLDSAIFATLNALSLGNNKVITISNSEEQGIVLEKLGAEVIYPYKDSVSRLVKRILNNNFLDYLALTDDVGIIEIEVPKKFVGLSLIESNIRQEYGLNIIAIESNNEIVTRIDPNYKFQTGDCIVVIGDEKSFKNFEND